MKKTLLIFIAVFIGFSLWADDEDNSVNYAENNPKNETVYSWELEEKFEEKQPFRMKDRVFEIGLVNISVGVANDFLTARGILQKNAVIDLDELARGFRASLSFDYSPFNIKFNWKNKWGFGLANTHVEASGNTEISGNLLGLKNADKDKFGVGAAVFVDVGFPGFFHIKKFKIKARPAWYTPLAYAEPDFSYTNKEVTNPDGSTGTILELTYDMRIYTPFSLKDIVDEGSFDGKFSPGFLGFDLSGGVEYPLFTWLDLGVDIKNIPLVPAKLQYYMQMRGSLFVDTSKINFNDILDGKELPDDAYNIPDDFDFVYGSGKKYILRPFKMVFFADYHPFDTRVLSLIPSLGFAVNPLYVKPGSVEGGLKLRCDLANIFIPTIGIVYEDRLWKNGIDLVLNLRALEFDFGLVFQSQNFVKSWQGGGFGVNWGMKIGW